jgi:hypothetical protein
MKLELKQLMTWQVFNGLEEVVGVERGLEKVE